VLLVVVGPVVEDRSVLAGKYRCVHEHSAGCKPANLGTKGQHATSRPPKLLMLHCKYIASLVTPYTQYSHCGTCANVMTGMFL